MADSAGLYRNEFHMSVQAYFDNTDSWRAKAETLKAVSDQLIGVSDEKVAATVRQQTTSLLARWQVMCRQVQVLKQCAVDEAARDCSSRLATVRRLVGEAEQLVRIPISCSTDCLQQHLQQVDVSGSCMFIGRVNARSFNCILHFDRFN